MDAPGAGGIAPDPAEHDDTERRPLNTIPCSASVSGWDLFCSTYGVTRTSLIDAVGHALGAMAKSGRLDATADCEAVVELARSIDVARRRRPKNGR